MSVSSRMLQRVGDLLKVDDAIVCENDELAERIGGIVDHRLAKRYRIDFKVERAPAQINLGDTTIRHLLLKFVWENERSPPMNSDQIFCDGLVSHFDI